MNANNTHDLIEQCNHKCQRIMTTAEAGCQALWNALHANRQAVIDVGGAMAEVNRRCRVLRDDARKECERVREATRSARQKLSGSAYAFAS